MAVKDLFTFRQYLAFPLYSFQIAHHNRKWLRRTVLQDPESCHGLLICCITAQMESSDPLDRDDLPIDDRLTDTGDRRASPLLSARQIYLRPAVIAAHRLCIVSARLRMCIFIRTLRAHRKFTHTRSFAVIRHGIQDRESWPACGTIDKRMHIPPVFRIVQLLFAFRTGRDIRRNEDIALLLLALNNVKLRKRHVLARMDIDFQNRRPLRRVVLQILNELLQFRLISAGINFYIRTLIGDTSCHTRFICDAADKRTETYALNNTIYTNDFCFFIIHIVSLSFYFSYSHFPETAKCGTGINIPEKSFTAR